MLSAVREEVEPLREKIKSLTERNTELKRENRLLRSLTYQTSLNSDQLDKQNTVLNSGQNINLDPALNSGQITKRQTALESNKYPITFISGQVTSPQQALISGQITNYQPPLTSGPMTNIQTALIPGQIMDHQPALTSGQVTNNKPALISGQNTDYQPALNSDQLLSEKISGAEGTKLDEDFMEMERKIDVTNKSVFELLTKTTEYLQPNPASRAKLGMLNTMSKIRGQVKTTGYPQSEGLLGDCMLRYGRELGDDSTFGIHTHPYTHTLFQSNNRKTTAKDILLCVGVEITLHFYTPRPTLSRCALMDVGEALKQMADIKDSLDINVKQNFIDPLQALQDKDLKEIGHHLKKLEGRRLDFDYKKKRQGKIPDEEIKQAVEKFEESKELAERSMFNFLENDVEQVSQLAALMEAALEYHRQSTEILEELNGKLQSRINTASSKPKKVFKPKSIMSSLETIDRNQHNGVSYTSSLKSTVDYISNPSPINPEWSQSPRVSSQTELHMDQPCCRSLYDFEPENEGELGFKEGDIIILTNQIDENWYEGMINGESGFFPINYVEVLVPLPQ
ncbi:Endophilin-A3 [Bagarius yarrelli]|uniref:Endophilin-A3 n=2 Tax=Otophysi TaxID=186626 RepID=A0A556TSJ4_BAGYA|nr:Endophilin-A3 [Bagarius yarrelli]